MANPLLPFELGKDRFAGIQISAIGRKGDELKQPPVSIALRPGLDGLTDRPSHPDIVLQFKRGLSH